jgi:hypothetical protein
MFRSSCRRAPLSAVQIAERASAAEAKDAKRRARELATPVGAGLPLDLVLELFKTLDPRSLLWLATCSKTLRALFDEHMDAPAALRCVLLGGGSKTGIANVRAVIALLRKKQIFTPSPLRLLRLACAKNCERPGCATGATAKQVREEYGVFFCWPCVVEHGTCQVQRSAATALMAEPRAARHSSKPYIWGRDYSRGGERCGPLVTRETYNRLVAEKSTLATFLADEQLTNDPAPLVAAFDSLKGAAEALELEAYNRAKVGKASRADAKQAKVKAFEAKLRELLAGSLPAPWPATAFACCKAQELLAPLRKAPSKATKRQLVSISAELAGAFGPVVTAMDEGFASLAFLSTGDPFESALLLYFARKWARDDVSAGGDGGSSGGGGGGGGAASAATSAPPGLALPPKLFEHAKQAVFDLLREGDLRDAFVRLVGSQPDTTHRFMCGHSSAMLKAAISAMIDPDHPKLAMRAFCSRLPRGNLDKQSFDAMKQAHAEALPVYASAAAAAERYLSREWMDEDTKAEYESFPKYKSCSIGKWMAKVWDGDGFAQLVKGDDESFKDLLTTQHQELSHHDWDFWR